MNEYGLRDDTMETVMEAVGTLENNYLTPEGGSDEPIDLKDAVDYCYREFEDIIQTVYGHSTASRFDGKQKILKAIEAEILKNQYIILKGQNEMTLKLGKEMVEIPINTARYARKKYNLTQQQLADLTGIPFRTIQNWEGGQRKCPEYVEAMILDLLDRKFNQPDYKAILEETLDMLEGDLKHLKTAEAKTYVYNLITDIKDSIK